MARMTIVGLSDYQKLINTLETSVEPICKMAVFEGAKIVADEMVEQIKKMEPPNNFSEKKEIKKKQEIKFEKQKQGLIEGLGISAMQKSEGVINTKIGFAGYNDVSTPKYPSGQPNLLIARSFESGTSFSPKYKFVEKARRKSKKAAEGKMAMFIDEKLRAAENMKKQMKDEVY